MILSLGDVMSLATVFSGRSDFALSEISRLANLALTEVANRLHHKSKEAKAVSNVTGTGNEREFDLPSDFDGVVALKWYSTSTDADTGENILGREVDLPIVDTTILDSYSSTSGEPARFALFANAFEVDPIPNSRGSLVLRYVAKQPTLVLSSATPSLDERWHPGWLYKTVSHVCASRLDVSGAAKWGQEYVNYMISTPNDRTLEQSAKHGLGLQVRKS